jgi:FkbM family methyltransferase
MGFMNRLEWYRTALNSLGPASLIRRQYQRARGPIDRPHKLTSKALRHPVCARPATSDYLVFDQIFVEQQYRCLDTAHIQTGGLIIDCGANVGYASAYFLSRYPTCVVVAVEPEQSNFEMLERNVRPYRNSCIAIQGAVWPHPEDVVTLKPTGKGEEWGFKVQRIDGLKNVRTFTIQDLIPRGFNRISLLKIDIEGAEIELFKTRPERWLGLVDNIVVELHGTEAERVFHEAIAPYGFNISRFGELTVCLRDQNSL